MGFSIARCSPDSRKNVQSFAVEFGQRQRILIDHVAHARTVPKNPTIASLAYEPEVRFRLHPAYAEVTCNTCSNLSYPGSPLIRSTP